MSVIFLNLIIWIFNRQSIKALIWWWKIPLTSSVWLALLTTLSQREKFAKFFWTFSESQSTLCTVVQIQNRQVSTCIKSLSAQFMLERDWFMKKRKWRKDDSRWDFFWWYIESLAEKARGFSLALVKVFNLIKVVPIGS